jgi:hypothetical protein
VRVTPNGDMGYMRREILAKSEKWIPVEGGERAHFECMYQTEAGWVTPDELTKMLEAA